jgi:glutathione-specific gamma-glutamylcyclotransferase
MRAKLVLTPELVARVERKVPQDHLPDDPNRVRMADADYVSAVADVLAGHPGRPIWVFAYGSLLWNPGFEFDERRTVTLRGWHRSFCMELNRFRGSPEQPGLMLALEQGGCCKGEAFRISGNDPGSELEKLFRREVPFRRTPRPWRWVNVDLAGVRQKALTFYAGMRGDVFHVKHPLHQQAHMLARAAGFGGSGAFYLQQTVARLEEQGIHDSYLWELQRLVAAEIEKAHPPA